MGNKVHIAQHDEYNRNGTRHEGCVHRLLRLAPAFFQQAIQFWHGQHIVAR